jgi:hypothetical protein
MMEKLGSKIAETSDLSAMFMKRGKAKQEEESSESESDDES